ncbi:MAG: RICIN domain-containing protein [Micromonosporaceae bacterium]
MTGGFRVRRWHTTAALLTAAVAAAVGILVAIQPAQAGEVSRVVNYKSKKCAYVGSYSTRLVTQRWCGTSGGFRWNREKRTDAGTYYWIWSTSTGKCLTARTVDGYVEQRECDVRVSRQRWQIYYAGGTSSGIALWRIKNASGRCLGVQGGSTASGVRLIHWPCGSYADHKWYFR